MTANTSDEVFSQFAKPLRDMISEKGFLSATDPQVKAIPEILKLKNILLVAPTGTGKTEAVFLPLLNTLYVEQERSMGIRLLYITPLRALNRDLLERLEWWCKRLDIRLAVRHGDTEVKERGRQAMAPPDVMVTTPETLQAILSGWVLRHHLRKVRWVIVDEVHELAGEKRGSQLSIALERLRYIVEKDFQVMGLSATVGTPEKVANFLVGEHRTCEIVSVPVLRGMNLEIIYPSPVREDFTLASQLYTYPEVAARLRIIRRLVEEHRSALIFTNTRTESEILASRFRMWDSGFPIGIHHGSLSRPTRMAAEKDLKYGSLRGLICTSSLELGIDVGLLDLVLQYNSPRQVSRLLQRVGRSGHRIGGVAKGVIITQDSDDTFEAAVICRRALAENIEPIKIPEAPYDVLGHQIVGLLMQKRRWGLDEILSLVRRAYPFRNLSEDELGKVLAYFSDRYPRIIWYSREDKVIARPSSTKAFYDYYFQNLSMIPEQKQFLVLDEEGSPIGVLDEVFVAEHGEVGTKFIIAGRAWKIIYNYRDKVYVKAESDPTGAIPTWVGEEIPVPYEIAMEVGEIRHRVEEGLNKGRSMRSLAEELSVKYPVGVETVLIALREVKEHVGVGQPVATDRRITVEQWEDYVIVQGCFGHQVNCTLSRTISHLLTKKFGVSMGAHQDPYRFIFKGEVTPGDIKATLIELAQLDFEIVVREALSRSAVFKRRFIHVGKKLGALAKDVDLSSATLETIIQAFRGSVVYEEAMRMTLHEDTDIVRTIDVLERIKSGAIGVSLLETQGKLTPTARVAMEELLWKSDLIAPEKMKRLIIESTGARLTNEIRTIVCTSCWNHVESIRVTSLKAGWRCPECDSVKYGMSEQPEEVIRRLSEKVHLHGTEIPKRYRRMHNRIVSSGRLIEEYGFAAVLMLAAKGLRQSDILDTLKKEMKNSDMLIENILEAERDALKRSFDK